ncbi:GRP family sugar transporter [Acidicapsa ligni]|uniref:GRP family sugar transporter n=1 Tax=Acidicapsa ligni TaxID=542300 RepID=UPI0021E00CF8|nr:GRP family sugar transporter [Acidicapsa ligni]
MYQPETYAVALFFMICTMLCWGSWANTLKLAPGYRFQLFYWDYVIGLFAGALLLGLTLGSHGTSAGASGRSFLADLHYADHRHIHFALIGGILFNIANLLLVAAIDIAGLAVAFPIGIGLALVVGAVSSYLLAPAGNPLMLFGGVALVAAAILCDALAYRAREATRQATSMRGIVLSLVAGLLMGTFYPFVSKAMSATAPGERAPGPYATAFFFVIGVAICAIPVNYLLMRRPLDGKVPAAMSGYIQARPSWHLWGIIGGIIWCIGATLNFVASRTGVVGPAVSYSIGQGATMITAAWGVFIWKEFASAPRRAKQLLFWMFVLFLSGLTLVALAPLY